MDSSYPFGKSIHAHGSRHNLAIAREYHLQEIRRPGSDRAYPPSVCSSLDIPDDHHPSGDTPNLDPESPPDISVNIRGATLPSSPLDSPDPSNTLDRGRLSIFPARSTSPEQAPSHDETRPPTPTATAHAHFVDDLPTRSASPASLRGRPRSRPSRPATPSTLGVPSRGHSPCPSVTPSTLGIPSRAGSPSPSVASLRSAHIFPSVPQSFSRYQTRDIVGRPTDDPGPLDIPPFTTDFMRGTPAPPGWKFVIHPEGQPYFVYQAQCFRVYTDSNLFDHGIRRRVQRDILDIHAKMMPTDTHRMGSCYDLAMETYRENGIWYTAYYLADHTKQTVFFVDVFNARSIPIIGGLKGVQELRHVQFELTAQYWHHVQSYPTCRHITRQDLCELRDEVMHNIGDIKTSPYSTSPYPLKDLYEILSLLTPLEKNLDTLSPGSLTLVARFKSVFARGRFLNWHGLTCARLERTASVYGDRPKTTWLLRGISPFLFSAPDVVHRLLQKIWTDELLHQAVFDETIAKLNGEWQELILFATVMLATNVGFLSIESVDKGGGNSAAQIASYVSTLTSIGSVVLGLLLARQTKTKNRECADQMQDFLKRKHHKVHGLEVLAILYSLPYALIMWSAIFFLAALTIFVFFDGGTASRAIFSLCLASILVFLSWSIIMGWEKEPAIEERHDVPCGADAASIKFQSPSTSTIPPIHSGRLTPSDAHTGSRTMLASPAPIVGKTLLDRVFSAIGLRRPQGPSPPRQWSNLRRRRASTVGEVVVEPPPDCNV